MTAPVRVAQAEQRAEGTALMGLVRTSAAEDAAFAADLRAIWPTLPDWTYVETYYAPAFMGDPDIQVVQVWLCGATGELLLQSTQAVDEPPLLHVAFKPAPEIQPVRLYPEGRAPGLSKADGNRVFAAMHALYVRLNLQHRVPVPGVH